MVKIKSQQSLETNNNNSFVLAGTTRSKNCKKFNNLIIRNKLIASCLNIFNTARFEGKLIAESNAQFESDVSIQQNLTVNKKLNTQNLDAENIESENLTTDNLNAQNSTVESLYVTEKFEVASGTQVIIPSDVTISACQIDTNTSTVYEQFTLTGTPICTVTTRGPNNPPFSLNTKELQVNTNRTSIYSENINIGNPDTTSSIIALNGNATLNGNPICTNCQSLDCIQTDDNCENISIGSNNNNSIVNIKGSLNSGDISATGSTELNTLTTSGKSILNGITNITGDLTASGNTTLTGSNIDIGNTNSEITITGNSLNLPENTKLNDKKICTAPCSSCVTGLPNGTCQTVKIGTSGTTENITSYSKGTIIKNNADNDSTASASNNGGLAIVNQATTNSTTTYANADGSTANNENSYGGVAISNSLGIANASGGVGEHSGTGGSGGTATANAGEANTKGGDSNYGGIGGSGGNATANTGEANAYGGVGEAFGTGGSGGTATANAGEANAYGGYGLNGTGGSGGTATANAGEANAYGGNSGSGGAGGGGTGGSGGTSIANQKDSQADSNGGNGGNSNGLSGKGGDGGDGGTSICNSGIANAYGGIGGSSSTSNVGNGGGGGVAISAGTGSIANAYGGKGSNNSTIDGGHGGIALAAGGATANAYGNDVGSTIDSGKGGGIVIASGGVTAGAIAGQVVISASDSIYLCAENIYTTRDPETITTACPTRLFAQNQNSIYGQINFEKETDFKINYLKDGEYNEISGEFKAYCQDEHISNITGKIIGQVLDYDNNLIQLDLLISFDIDEQNGDIDACYKAKLYNKSKSIYYHNKIDRSYAKVDYLTPLCTIKRNKIDGTNKYNMMLSITCIDTQVNSLIKKDMSLVNLEKLLTQFFKDIKINLKQKIGD